ncbi:MAG TPA: glycoside hydrolase family 2, partial [Chitinophagaceae bacterium]|nr:glycoside hydrolase family 2 [Chitinophagaceae bacterium]
ARVPLENCDLIAAVPASRMEPAYDLKPVTSYKAINARFTGPGIGKGIVDGKERVIFKKASAQNKIEWDFNTGVADVYSLTITYNNPHRESIPAKVELLSADGTLMRTETVMLMPTRPGKSNYINSGTGTMINAGHYVVRLTSPMAVNVSVNALDVQ